MRQFKDIFIYFRTKGDHYTRPKLEVAIDDNQLDQVVEGIQKAANTGKIGDGKIFVFDLEQVMRIRTAETGSEAL